MKTAIVSMASFRRKSNQYLLSAFDWRDSHKAVRLLFFAVLVFIGLALVIYRAGSAAFSVAEEEKWEVYKNVKGTFKVEFPTGLAINSGAIDVSAPLDADAQRRINALVASLFPRATSQSRQVGSLTMVLTMCTPWVCLLVRSFLPWLTLVRGFFTVWGGIGVIFLYQQIAHNEVLSLPATLGAFLGAFLAGPVWLVVGFRMGTPRRYVKQPQGTSAQSTNNLPGRNEK